MAQPCATSKCERVSRALCDCCQQNLCLQHLYEHNALIISQLNPLTDEINALGDRLNTYKIQGITNDSRHNLEKWRQDCYQTIDRFFEKKCEELDQLMAAQIDQQREKLLHIRTKVDKLIRQQEATRQDIDIVTSSIRQLEKEMDKIEHTQFQTNMRSLVIDESMVQIKETLVYDFNPMSFSSVHKKLKCNERSYPALTSNDRFLLIHQHPNLCLVDKEMNIVKQILWANNEIWDMCWSSTLARFILIEENNLYLLDGEKMFVEDVSIVEKRR